MDYKLKAITNNVDNDRIDLISSKQNDVEKNLNEEENVASSHICDKKVPVIFSTTHGVHLRTFDKNSTSNYMITFCDLERWNFRKNHIDSIGLTSSSTSRKSSTFRSIKIVQEAPTSTSSSWNSGNENRVNNNASS